jgi:ABC-type transport system involved in Fe-S cluster assembly fused permease/ATPase subunit
VTALLFVDAIDTASTLLNAIFLWIVAAAFVATVAIYTVILTGVVTWRAVTRAVTGAWRAAHATQAPEVAENATEPHTPVQPAWAHAEKEAA